MNTTTRRRAQHAEGRLVESQAHELTSFTLGVEERALVPSATLGRTQLQDYGAAQGADHGGECISIVPPETVMGPFRLSARLTGRRGTRPQLGRDKARRHGPLSGSTASSPVWARRSSFFIARLRFLASSRFARRDFSVKRSAASEARRCNASCEASGRSEST